MSSITIVGCGPGSKEYATLAALNVIRDSDMLIGAKRLIDEFVTDKHAVVFTTIEDTLKTIGNCKKKVAVLVTGDPVFFSLTSCIIREFGKISVSIIPGLSSITYAFGRMGIPWHDAAFMSAHKELPKNLNEFVKRCPKIGLLTSPKYSVEVLAGEIDPVSAVNRRFFVGQNLSYRDESLKEYKFEELKGLKTDPLSVLIITTMEQ